MGEKFGARLRERREAQRIGLDAVARDTKIKLSLLEALEQDDVSQWPGGLFRRAFIRAYARVVGLEPDAAVRDFLAAFPDPPEVVASQTDAAVLAALAKSAPPTRLQAMVGSAIESLSRLRSPGPTAERPAPPPTTDVPEAPAPVDPPRVDRPRVDPPPKPVEPDLLAVARLCTALSQVERAEQIPPLLEETARLLGAKGLIVWLWDESAEELRPVLAHGYSDKLIVRLPVVTRESDNATAAAFRTAQPCAIDGGDHSSGALVVPLLTPAGCSGVLAIEFQHRADHPAAARAVAVIVAAVLSPLVGVQAQAEHVVLAASRESA